MDAKELPARPDLERYKKLAKDLLKAYKSGDSAAIERFKQHRQFDHSITWEQLRAEVQRRMRKLTNSATRGDSFVLADAQFLIARSHGFESWPKFKKHLEAAGCEASPASRFESAADAVIAGAAAALRRMLRENPELIRARSARVHRSTLLHYVSANGVEDFRQKTPRNAVAIAKILLNAGAEAEAENDPGRGTTLGLVATSVHPANAGLQIALLETLLEAGASPDGLPEGWNPLTAALANGRGDAAGFLAARGAKLDLEGAAGVGRFDVVEKLFTHSTPEQIESGFAWACEYGRTRVVDFLLRHGMAVGHRLKPHGQTALHWAAYGAHADIVKLLLKFNAPVDARDGSYGSTPLGWALHAWGDRPPEFKNGNYYDVVALLVAAGAAVDPEWRADEKMRADPQMLAALGESH